MSLPIIKITIIEYCRKLYDKGYLPGLDGNVSMRVDEDSMLITPSGLGKDIVAAEDLVHVRFSGKPVGTGDRKPSIETPMHISAYVHDKTASAVIHMHSPYATSFALARHPIDTRHAPFAHFHLGETGYVNYSTPGGNRFHEDVSACISAGHKVLLLESHGAMVLGTDMPSAYAKADLLENYAKMLILAKPLGGAYRLRDDELHDIYGG